MIKKYLEYLVDPVSGKELKVNIFEEVRGRVRNGILYSNDSWYPIVDYIPRLLTGEMKVLLLQRKRGFFDRFSALMTDNVRKEWGVELKKRGCADKFNEHQKDTADSFAFEWKNIYKENNYERNNFFHFMSPFVKSVDLRNKITLDIGCGSGRFTKWAALAGTKVSFGMDLGDSVEAAYEMTKNMKNVCIVQADIYNPPFLGRFDLAYSIGVLHHLPKPKEGFLGLPKVLKKNGKMLIWVYSRRNNNRALYFYEPIRSITNKINKKVLYQFCYIPAFVVHLINYLTKLLRLVGLKRLSKKIPFFYYANFPFNMKLNDAFDVLATPKSNYYYIEEIVGWFKEAKLEDIKAYEHSEAGITCVGRYEI